MLNIATFTDTLAPDCPECSDDTDFDMCQECYREGKTCHSPDDHRLYVYLRANVDRPHPDFATDGISCKGCETKIKQGPFYCEQHPWMMNLLRSLTGLIKF